MSSRGDPLAIFSIKRRRLEHCARIIGDWLAQVIHTQYGTAALKLTPAFMKAPAVRYVRPASLEQVFNLLEHYGDEAKILAGGQSLIAALNMRLTAPTVLIDINGLPGLSGIVLQQDTVRIGALTRHRELERSAEVARHLPLVSQAIPHIAHAAIRNRGTFGGSIAFADPAAELPACSVALNAQFVLASVAGERRVAARRFFRGLYEVDLQCGELLVAAEFPALKPGYRSVFMELSRRHGDYALVGVAAHAAYGERRFSGVSMVFFGVGAAPVLAGKVSSVLEGCSLSGSTVAAVQAAVNDDLEPYDEAYQSGATKLHLARVLAGRAVGRLAANR